MNAKEWANEIVNGRVKGDQFELLEIADAIDELWAERDAARAELAILPNTRSSPLVEPENLTVTINPAAAEKGAGE